MNMDGYIIGSAILAIGIAGIAGNSLFCYAVYKRPEIRGKHSFLLAVNCSVQVVCIAFEFVNAICQMSHKQWHRSECLNFIAFYLFLGNYQAMMYVVVGADMLFALFAPLRYLRLPHFPYLLLLQLPAIAFGIEHPLHAFLHRETEDPIIFACNPPLGTSDRTMQMWNISNIVLSLIVLLIYATIAFRMKCQARGADESTARARLSKGVIRAAFLFSLFFSASWFLSKINDRFAVLFPNLPGQTIEALQTYSVIPAVASFAQTYYVHLLMSKDYREAFKKSGLFGYFVSKDDKKSTTVSMPRSTH
ncbi:hypothetical protein PMAYCL1PPCAC_04275, partial [Pristionchus mayeri]